RDLHSLPTRRSSDLFPNPYYQYRSMFSLSGYQPGETSQWYSIWDAIRARRPVEITIRPEDIYGAADASPSCFLVNPVIEKMGLRSEEHTSELQSLRH